MERAQSDEPTREQSADVFFKLMRGYMASAACIAACQLDLFTHLADGPQTAAEVARRCGASTHGAELLLKACVGLGLLDLNGAAYRNTPMTEQCLVRDAPQYIGAFAGSRNNEHYRAWGQLGEAVRSGNSVDEHGPDAVNGLSDGKIENYVLGLYDRGKVSARILRDQVDLSGRARLLDLAAGSGVYSFALLDAYAELAATLFDLPRILAVTKTLVPRHASASRIALRPGDYRADDLGSGYDAALLSNILQTDSEAGCRALLRKVHASLEPGGLIIVNGIMTDESGTQPLDQALFSLSMLLSFGVGRAYSAQAISGWLSEAGFENHNVQPPAGTSLHTVITARKPA